MTAQLREGGPATDAVVLRIPRDPRFIRVARLAVGGVASLIDLDVEVIEDLRIAVDELCAAMLEVGAGPIDVTVTTTDAAIRIEATSSAGQEPLDEARFALSKQILAVIADDFGLDVTGGTARCWIERSTADWSSTSREL
jgi:serine/threonine-protein kinase RsbW